MRRRSLKGQSQSSRDRAWLLHSRVVLDEAILCARRGFEIRVRIGFARSRTGGVRVFEMRIDRTHTETVGCLRIPGTVSANGAAAHCREATLVFTGPHGGSSSSDGRTLTYSSAPTPKSRMRLWSYLGPRNKCRIVVSAVEQSQLPRTSGKTRPNQSFQGTKTRALRGFCPLNSNR